MSLHDYCMIKFSTSETLSGPPNLSMSSSNVLRGSSFPSMDILCRRSCFISSILAVDSNKTDINYTTLKCKFHTLAPLYHQYTIYSILSPF